MSDDKEENKKKREEKKNSEDKKKEEPKKENSEKNNINKEDSDKKENKETKKIISKPKIKNKSIKRYVVYGIVLVILILAGILAFSMDNNQGTDSEIVAKVNQEEITREDLDSYKVMLEQQGQASDDMTAIQSLINQKILSQEAKKEIEISSSETEEIMKQQLSNQGMTLEDFKNQVKNKGQSYEEVMESFKQQIILSQYYQSIINESETNITDEEAKDFYEENKEIYLQQAPNSSYEDLEETIKEQLKNQKTQESLQNKIMKLRENADIEIIEENLNQTQQNQMDLSQLQQ